MLDCNLTKSDVQMCKIPLNLTILAITGFKIIVSAAARQGVHIAETAKYKTRGLFMLLERNVN